MPGVGKGNAMERTIVVHHEVDLDGLEKRIRNGTRGLAIALGFMSRRLLDNWDGGREQDNLLRFLHELNEGDIGQDPLNDDEKITLGCQASLTFRYVAAISAIRWLYGKHPKIEAYAFNVDDDSGVDGTGFQIVSRAGEGRVAATVVWCTDHVLTMQTKRAALYLMKLNDADGFTAKYVFVMAQNAHDEEYAFAGEREGIPIMLRGVAGLTVTNN